MLTKLLFSSIIALLFYTKPYTFHSRNYTFVFLINQAYYTLIKKFRLGFYANIILHYVLVVYECTYFFRKIRRKNIADAKSESNITKLFHPKYSKKTPGANVPIVPPK